MYNLRGFFLAASAVLFFACGAAAMDPGLLALNTPAKSGLKISSESKTAAQKAPAAEARPAAAPAAVPASTDFDAVSVNDPLYREGAKEMLKQAVKEDVPAKDGSAPALRDAPISKDAKPAKPLKKSRAKKPVHSDPVKAKNAL